MNIHEIIEKRRSVRAFRDDPIPDDILDKILGAGRMAPSAHNAQDYKFIVVREKEKKKEVARVCSEQRFIAEAPVIIVGVSTNPEHILSSGVPAYPADVAIAIDHMTLAAVEEGFGTCWVGSFSQEDLKSALGVPKEYKIVALFPLGAPYDDPGIKSRKSIKDLFCYEKFSD